MKNLKTRRSSKTLKTITEETDILPDVVADTVVHFVEQHLYQDLPNREKAVDHLTEYAESVFKHSEHFRKMMKARGNKGRDNLYKFMEHWLASWMKKNQSALYKKLPDGYGWSYHLFDKHR